MWCVRVCVCVCVCGGVDGWGAYICLSHNCVLFATGHVITQVDLQYITTYDWPKRIGPCTSQEYIKKHIGKQRLSLSPSACFVTINMEIISINFSIAYSR